MLYYLLAPLASQFEPFNLFRYQTFRGAGAVVTALVISFLAGPYVIEWLKSKQAPSSRACRALRPRSASRAFALATSSLYGL